MAAHAEDQGDRARRQLLFVNGTYQLPSDNSTARKTRGLNAAISTNAVSKGTSIGTGLTLTGSTDKVTATSHGMSNGDRVKVTNLVTTTGISEGGCYFVVSSATNDFKLSLTAGGSAIDLVGDGTADITKLAALTEATLLDGLQSAYDNGGLSEGETRVLLVNSRQRRAVTAVFADAYGKADPVTGNVAGVSVQEIQTDFGKLKVMMDRAVYQDTALILSLEQLSPVFLEVPGKATSSLSRSPRLAPATRSALRRGRSGLRQRARPRQDHRLVLSHQRHGSRPLRVILWAA